MRISAKIFAAFFLLFFLSTAPSTADIISAKIRSDNRDMILFSNFEFSHTGYVSVAVNSIDMVTSNLSQLDSSSTGFVLLSDKLSYDYDHNRNPVLCPFDNKSTTVLFTFQDLLPLPQPSYNKSFHVTHPGKYSLYFANCNNQSLVTMNLRTELYNTDDNGTTKDYLSADQPQPSFYSTFFFLYLCLLGFWIFVCFKNQHCFQMIHLLMGVLLVMNLLHFSCAGADQHDLMVTGTHHVWRIFFYISHFMRDMYFFTVMVLIGAGWCNWRRFLPRWVILIMASVILLQVLATVSLVAVDKSGPYSEDWIHLTERFWAIDYICCVLVFVNSCVSVDYFNNATERSYISLEKIITTRENVFHFLLFLFVMLPRALTHAMEATMFKEACTLALSIGMFYMFRPFVLEDEDQKRAKLLA